MEKTLNGTKGRMEKTLNGKNAEWYKMLNGKTPNGTKRLMKKRRMVQNVESKIGKKNICKYFWFFITTKWLHWYYYILTDNHYSKKYITPSIRHFVIQCFVPFDIICIQHFVPFDIISILHFVPFDIMSHLAFITFDIMSIRRFVPFDILSVRHFVSFDILLFGILSHSTICRSTFCTFGVCYFDILSVNLWRYLSSSLSCSQHGRKILKSVPHEQSEGVNMLPKQPINWPPSAADE